MSGSNQLARTMSVVSSSGFRPTIANFWALTQTLLPRGRADHYRQTVDMAGNCEVPTEAIWLFLLLLDVTQYVFVVKEKKPC